MVEEERIRPARQCRTHDFLLPLLGFFVGVGFFCGFGVSIPGFFFDLLGFSAAGRLHTLLGKVDLASGDVVFTHVSPSRRSPARTSRPTTSVTGCAPGAFPHLGVGVNFWKATVFDLARLRGPQTP